MNINAALMEMLNAFLWEKPITEQMYEWALDNITDLFRVADEQNIKIIAAYKINEYARTMDNEEAAAVAEATEGFCTSGMSRCDERVRLCRELFAEFNKNNIDYIPFKGIVVREYYPVPQLRTFGDIDVIIKEYDREKSHKLMLGLGYEPGVPSDEVYDYTKGIEYYEIHTDIMSVEITDRADYNSYFKKMWDYAEYKDGCEYLFNMEFHFVYLLAHIAKHINVSGAGIRMYLDLACIIKAVGNKLDWDKIRKEVKKIKLDKFFVIALTGVERWFGVKIPIKLPEVEQKLMDDFYEYTFDAGIFGYCGRSTGEEMLRKTRMQGEKEAKLKTIKKLIFPPIKQIKPRYTYLEKHPYLLPVAWVDRIIRNRKIIGSKARQSKDIIGADVAEINEKIMFYRKIGL